MRASYLARVVDEQPAEERHFHVRKRRNRPSPRGSPRSSTVNSGDRVGCWPSATTTRGNSFDARSTRIEVARSSGGRSCPRRSRAGKPPCGFRAYNTVLRRWSGGRCRSRARRGPAGGAPAGGAAAGDMGITVSSNQRGAPRRPAERDAETPPSRPAPTRPSRIHVEPLFRTPRAGRRRRREPAGRRMPRGPCAARGPASAGRRSGTGFKDSTVIPAFFPSRRRRAPAGTASPYRPGASPAVRSSAPRFVRNTMAPRRGCS